MAYNRIFWKDRIVALNDDNTINKIIQEGTPLSAFNLNRMDDGIWKIYYDTELMKKNQLELLISRDKDNQRVTMDEGFWFDSLKNENKVQSKSNMAISDYKLGISSGNASGEIEFKTHDIGFKTNKTVYYHKRKSQFATLESASNKTTEDNNVEVVAEIITITY